MRKRWRVALGVAGVAVAAFIGRQLLPGPRLGPASFHRLREGMTEQEVADVLGCPAGDYRTAPPRRAYFSRVDALLRERAGREPKPAEEWNYSHNGRRKEWWGDVYLVLTDFDEDGRVVDCTLWDVLAPEPLPVTGLRALRHWARRVWP